MLTHLETDCRRRCLAKYTCSRTGDADTRTGCRYWSIPGNLMAQYGCRSLLKTHTTHGDAANLVIPQAISVTHIGLRKPRILSISEKSNLSWVAQWNTK